MADGQTGQPLADVVAEAERVGQSATAAGLQLKVTGGVGVALNCPAAAHEPLRRAYADLDLVGRARDRNGIVRMMESLGYQGNEVFNTLNGATRLLFWDAVNGRQVDVFLDKIAMCHRIDLSGRLGGSRITLEPADLLLMKLQIFETNEKDLGDIVTLLQDLDYTADDTGINLPYLGGLLGSDWGLWRTTTIVAQRADEYARGLAGYAQAERTQTQVARFIHEMELAPKTRGWKLRARVGESRRWYELPEEVR